MKHTDIVETLKKHFRETLNMLKNQVDIDGCLPENFINCFNEHIQMIPQFERDKIDCQEEYLIPHEKTQLYQSLQTIIQKYNLDFPSNSTEYAMLKKEHKYALRNLYQEALEYSHSVHNYRIETPARQLQPSNNLLEVRYTLEDVMNRYLEEITGNMTQNSLDTQKSLLEYLYDCFDSSKPIHSCTHEDARQVKENLRNTPINRKNTASLKNRTLLEQIELAKKEGLTLLSTTTANKYLKHFNALFSWAKSNKYISENIFEGMQIKQSKKQDVSREAFTKDEIKIILAEIESNTHGTIKNSSHYWGSLLCIYTGARKNEITSLTIDDVKQHKDIWYIEITDTDGKSLKTKASKRIIPIHSKLIELGFLEFLEHSRQYAQKKPLTDAKTTRLLYDFTYTEKGQWGRKLGYFFNEGLLKSLGLYQNNKKVLHSLRHSFVTYLGVAQVDASIIQSIVGHEQNTVTHSTYTHYGLDHLPQFKEAIEKLGY